MEIGKTIDGNIDNIKKTIGTDKTIIFRAFENGTKASGRYCVVFINNIVDKTSINEFVIKPLMELQLGEDDDRLYDINNMLNKIIPFTGVKKSSDFNLMIADLLSGSTILLIDGASEVLLIDTVKHEQRSIDEPESEKVVRGPREGFTESIDTNISLIRKRIKTPDLKLIFKEIGTLTKTSVCICYIENIAPKDVLDELVRRLDDIEIDGIIDSGYIQEMIKDDKASPYKTIGNTERPDTVVGKLLEGRIIVLCDGSPFALTLPFMFMEYFQVNEDYYNNYFYASITRTLRYIGFFLTLSIAPIYLSLVTYHQELIPSPLLLSIASARKGLPLPTVVEALVMLLVFQILREAGARLPTTIGQTISIVGALVIGQAAVEARLISAPMVIVIALTGITSFVVPRLAGPIIIIRLFFILVCSVLGFYGYILCAIFLLTHLYSIKSFGVPYMASTASTRFQEQKDMAIRAPWNMMYLRPKKITNKNAKRKG